MSEDLEKRSDEKLGDYLVRIRESRGMSQEELASKCGVNLRYLESIEKGEWKKFAVEAYLRSYLNSISLKLKLDPKQVLSILSSEIGSNYSHEFDAVDAECNFVGVGKETPKSKTKFIVVLILLIVILAALAFVLKLSDVEKLQNLVASPAQEPQPVAVEEVVQSAPEEPEGAEVVPLDTVIAVAEEEARRTTDSVAAAKDLPASATIFISSDSKKENADTAKVAKAEPVKLHQSKLELLANGKDSTWIGIKKSAASDNYVKQGKLAKEGSLLNYATRDTMFVLIGNPAAVGEMKINGTAVKLPANTAGRSLRFRVVNGKVLTGF